MNPATPARKRLLAFATQGPGGGDEARLRDLLHEFDADFVGFDRHAKGRKLGASIGIFLKIASGRPDLVVMEGTGIGGGLAVLLARGMLGVPFVVSSGDAIGPFVASLRPLLGPFFGAYERVLCRLSAGYIGWTPYLVGRAMTYGAPRGVTAPGWAPATQTTAEAYESRRTIRDALGVPSDALVIGIAGSLAWNPRKGYCYGLELVRAVKRVSGRDVHCLIVGDGDGRARLEALARGEGSTRFHFTGQVPREEVPRYLSAMDLASLPQSRDGVGSFRYTTKLSEYLGSGLPVVTSRIPAAYDLDLGWAWRMEGQAPWEEGYADAIAAFLGRVSPEEISRHREAALRAAAGFDRESQVQRVSAFLRDTLDEVTEGSK